ncbi:unnamed protein product [Cuscuta campestris]|uniref:Uncharacterized protein n=1 Tax=Cuscuta campestris TaxID=132261 RepID=A0A484M972_9ASTE|nr:unnamed protein product [Cuscuta campestris]
MSGAELRPESNDLSSGEVETNKFFSSKSATPHRSIQRQVPAATLVKDHTRPSTNFAGDPCPATSVPATVGQQRAGLCSGEQLPVMVFLWRVTSSDWQV